MRQRTYQTEGEPTVGLLIAVGVYLLCAGVLIWGLLAQFRHEWDEPMSSEWLDRRDKDRR